MNKFVLFACLLTLVFSQTAVQRYRHPLTILRCMLADTTLRTNLIKFVEAYKSGSFLDIFPYIAPIQASISTCWNPK